MSDIILAGWSLGGQIALEMAFILENYSKIKVNVILFDTILQDSVLLHLFDSINNEERKSATRKYLSEQGHLDEYINRVLSAYDSEKKLAATYISDRISSSVLMFKATAPDLRMKIKDADKINEHILNLHDNNIGSIAENLQIINLSCHHGNILEFEDILTDNIRKFLGQDE